ncbi:MAG TPA: DHHA1 domain-containing protein [Candidatus Paceibacterota bacterium]
MKKIVIIYHKFCLDGFGGAWAAWRKFGNKATYIGMEHKSPAPGGLKGKDVYMIDFSYKEQVIKKMLSEVKSLTIIDHHVSAEKVVKSLKNHLYAIDHSGAVLAWKYFHPNKKVPKLLAYIEDGDLWKFRLKNAKELIAFLITQSLDFKNWNKLYKDFESADVRKEFVKRGVVIINYESKVIQKAIMTADLVKFEGYKVMASNSAFLISEIGHALVNKTPPIGIIYSISGGSVKVSLRSNGKVDVSKIAVKYGGGGHKAASGFVFKLEDNFPWQKIK